MTAGKLAGVANPTTNTILYQSGGYQTASTVLHICNRTAGALTADVALRDYDQSLTLDAATYKYHEGNVVTGYYIDVDQNVTRGQSIGEGDTLTDATGEKSFKYHDTVPAGVQTINVKAVALTAITFEAQIGGTFAVGETITDGTASGYIYDVQNIDDNTTTENEATLWVGNITGGTFSPGSTISVVASGASATISNAGVATPVNKFVFEFPNHATSPDYQVFSIANTLSLLTDRNYEFDLSDSSLTGLVPRFSTTLNGKWGPDNTFGTADDGTEFTTGITYTGTPGSAGAKASINMLTSGLLAGNMLYMYEDTTGTAANMQYGHLITGGNNGGMSVSAQFTYKQFYIYDVEGTIAVNDTFTSGATTYTVQAVNAAAYGYVRRQVGATLHVILGKNSIDFATNDEILDSPAEIGGDRTMATVTAATASTTIADNQYIMASKSIAANSSEKVSSLVVGHGNSVVVKGSATGLTFVLDGFTDSTTDWAPTNYVFQSAGGAPAGGGGGANP